MWGNKNLIVKATERGKDRVLLVRKVWGGVWVGVSYLLGNSKMLLDGGCVVKYLALPL